IRLQGAVRKVGSSVHLTIQERGSEPQGDQPIAAVDSGSDLHALAGLVASKLVYRILDRLENDQVFRGAAIPSDPVRRGQLAKAEQFFSLGQWEEAQRAYAGVGPGCLLCVFRSLDIARWFGLP